MQNETCGDIEGKKDVMGFTRFASIDIGTVTCRLLIADVDDEGVMHELFREMAITNLGEGTDATHRLSSSAIARVARQVNIFMNDVARFDEPDAPVHVCAVATSAARDATNSDDLVRELAKVGVDLHVISGDREASLSFAGASSDFTGKNVLVADVGGGSTELIAGTAGKGPAFEHSFNFGSRRITERFLLTDPPTGREVRDAEDEFDPQFKHFFARLAENRFSIDRMVAVAGTATSAVSVDQQLEPYDPKVVNGSVVSEETLNTVLRKLIRMPLAERRNVKGLHPDRAPVIVAGMIILRSVLEASPVNTFTVSEHDLLQGNMMDAWHRLQASETQRHS